MAEDLDHYHGSSTDPYHIRITGRMVVADRGGFDQNTDPNPDKKSPLTFYEFKKKRLPISNYFQIL